MTEYEFLMKSLEMSLGTEKAQKILEQLKAVVTENNLEYTPKTLRDFFKLIELAFNLNLDKHYGKC